ncbi:enolase C-terminal domain-like protein [Streptomyces sp. NPDC038707]|uniref:enolase C-terminal domain-like protein n=1 Tax=unclassified Streptomyces TaxID=2593676 RepID=UPI0033E50191
MTITSVRVRGILDSRARVTLEAEVTLDSGHTGTGSAPRAIAPGRLERHRGPEPVLGPVAVPLLAAALIDGSVGDQQGCDQRLAELYEAGEAGSDLTLAVSLAYARAAAAARHLPLHAHLAEQYGVTRPGLPRLMVNVFSGGIHRDGPPRGFQQVMVLPATGRLHTDIEVADQVFTRAHQAVERRFGPVPLSASSGLLVPLDSEEQLGLLQEAVAEAGHTGVCAFGVDVAAEHLRTASGRYRFGHREFASDEFADHLVRLAHRFPLTFLEDPFDPADDAGWARLRASLPHTTKVVGDDLFATDAERVAPGRADGILLKLSQAGTVTATLAAAAAARRAGMLLAVSHRSGETEDTAMCDLAVAVAAELIKVGGPRRGDRLAKYNQLLRLHESLTGLVAAL